MSSVTTSRRRPQVSVAACVVFVALQGAVVALLLLVASDPALWLLVGAGTVAAVVWLVLLPVYPWLSVPLLMASTSLDITGRLVQETPLGVPVTGFHVSFLLMIVAVSTNAALRRRMTLPPFELAGPLVMLLGLIGLSLLWSPNQPEATISFMRMLLLATFLYLTQVTLDSRGAITCVVVSVAFCVDVAAILGVVQMLTEEFYLPASFVIAVGANTPRATGTFLNPNSLGTFLMAGSLLMMGVLLNQSVRGVYRWLLVLSIGIGTMGLLATFSRANWLAMAVGGVFLLWLCNKLKARFVVMGVAATAAVLALLQTFLPIADYVFTRLISIFTLLTEFGDAAHVSGSARVQFVSAALGMWRDNPLLGAGWRAFPVILDAYKPEGFPHWIPTRECHTLFATVIAELGLLGLLASIWLVWRIGDRGYRALRGMTDPYLRSVMIGLLSLFVGFQVSLSFTNDFTNNFLWFFTGMIFAVIELHRRQQRATAAPGEEVQR